VQNDRLLARGISGARLLLYPDAGHAFWFQDAARFVPAAERFLR
jgi:pimeloyl-ACP methyl ester carboxylesterase